MGRTNGLLSGVGFGLSSAWADQMKTPYNQQWNFTLQTALPGRWTLSGAYAGNRGIKLVGADYERASITSLFPPYEQVRPGAEQRTVSAAFTIKFGQSLGPFSFLFIRPRVSY